MRIRAHGIREKGGRTAAEHGIAAIVDVMPFSRINEAIERVRGRDVPMGLVLENRE